MHNGGMLITPYGQRRARALALLAWLPLGAWAAGKLPAPCDTLSTTSALWQVNAARSQGAVCGARGGMAASGALSWSASLYALAYRQAVWMADFGMLVHAGRDGETLSQRAAAAGYPFARIGENLAHGQSDLAQTLGGWTASESHCVNLYDPGVTEMALACVPGRDGRAFWVLVLGRPL
jgi:uncharacterized protein YkwD